MIFLENVLLNQIQNCFHKVSANFWSDSRCFHKLLTEFSEFFRLHFPAFFLEFIYHRDDLGAEFTIRHYATSR